MIQRMLAPVLALAAAVLVSAAAPQAPPDLAAIRTAMAGTWQSLDDPKFTRELDPDGRAADRYEGDESATTIGRWAVFLGSAPPAGIGKRAFQPDVVYLRLAQNGDVLLFALTGLTRSDMKMIYLERGNQLSFVRLK